MSISPHAGDVIHNHPVHAVDPRQCMAKEMIIVVLVAVCIVVELVHGLFLITMPSK